MGSLFKILGWHLWWSLSFLKIRQSPDILNTVFLKSNWNERTHFKLLSLLFQSLRKTQAQRVLRKNILPSVMHTHTHTHIYVWGLPPHTRRSSQIAEFGDYWQIFQRLRHNSESPGCFSTSFPIWDPKHRFLWISSQMKFTHSSSLLSPLFRCLTSFIAYSPPPLPAPNFLSMSPT